MHADDGGLTVTADQVDNILHGLEDPDQSGSAIQACDVFVGSVQQRRRAMYGVLWR